MEARHYKLIGTALILIVTLIFGLYSGKKEAEDKQVQKKYGVEHHFKFRPHDIASPTVICIPYQIYGDPPTFEGTMKMLKLEDAFPYYQSVQSESLVLCMDAKELTRFLTINN